MSEGIVEGTSEGICSRDISVVPEGTLEGTRKGTTCVNNEGHKGLRKGLR